MACTLCERQGNPTPVYRTYARTAAPMASIRVGTLALPAAATNDVEAAGDDAVAVALLPPAPPAEGFAPDGMLTPVAEEEGPAAAAVDVPAHEPETPVLTAVKLAQEMRVLLAKWRTKLRFPKKAPMPPSREA